MKLFITGVTGYIGGSVATRFLAAGHQVFGLVRTQAQADNIQALGIQPVLGDLDSLSPHHPIFAEVDGVINTANSDNPFIVSTLLQALRGTGKLLIHTSGSSVVGDKAEGAYSELVYHEETIQPLLEKQARVDIDQAVLKASHQGVRSVVICPTMIYGQGLGLKKNSDQIPGLIAAAKQFQKALHIGAGENVWSNVHIADLVELYLLAAESAPSGSFFFAENGEARLKDIVRAIGEHLGLGSETHVFPIADAIAHWGAGAAHFGLASNSRVSARKAKALLGWNPQHNSILASIANEQV